MKALLSKTAGGPETLVVEEIAEPIAGKGELLVAVKACAVNYPDVLVIQDLYQFRPERPFSPGSEIAGVVEAVGEGVTGFKPGDRVMGLTMSSGGMQEKTLIQATQAFILPDQHGFEEGASFLMTYGTSIHALLDRGRIKEGDTLLVLGAAGGVGLAAVELGAAFGARVVAAVSSEEKAQAARDAGAHETVIYGRAPFDKEQSKTLSNAFKAAVGPNGANIIYDAVGGDYADPAIRSIAWEGRYLVVGFPSGIPKLPLNLTLLKSCDVAGVFWGAFVMRDPAAHTDNMNRLFRLWRDGKINPRVTARFPLERGGEAIELLASRKAIGKVVVTP
jgi:NADPH:quinone reductase